MGNKINIKSIWLITKAQYRDWIKNPRMMICIMMLLVTKNLAVEPLMEHVAKTNIPLNFLEPFIAICNSPLLLMIMPCVFLILLSDYPKIDHHSYFVIYRSGKINWLLGQFFFSFFAIISFMLFIAIGSIFLHKGVWNLEWSGTVTDYIALFPEQLYDFALDLVPANLYNQMDITEALFHSFVLICGYLLILVCILSLFKILGFRVLGLCCVFSVIAIGLATTAVRAKIMWAFPMANSIVWYHYTEILRAPEYPIVASYIYIFGMIFVLFILNVIALKKMQIRA